MSPHNDLSAEYVRSILHYDPATGGFTWLVRPSNRVKIGGPAGNIGKKIGLQISIDGRKYLGSRLAWLYMTGEWPKDEIDHSDLNRSNSKWENLRPATRSENQWNHGAHNPKSKIKGVHWHPQSGGWIARIWKHGHAIYLGYFKDKQEAAAAYAAAAKQHHGEFARLA